MKKRYLIAWLIIFCEHSFSQISFSPYQAIHVGSTTEALAIADLNNDNLKDVVLVTGFNFSPTNDYRILIFYQGSSGTFLPPVEYPYTTDYPPAQTVSVGDVNNDQRLDIVIGRGDSLGVFSQNVSGTFDPMVQYYSGSNVDGVAISDLNNDGLNDIAVSHWNDLFIRIFYQNSGSFVSTTYPKVQSGFDEIEVGDVNGDGLNDVVFLAGNFASGIHVYTQNLAGGLNLPVSYYPPVGGSQVTFGGFDIGDLNGDGRNDIAVSQLGNLPYSKMHIYFQDTLTGLLRYPLSLDAYDIPEAVEIADLNCDGRNEIIAAHGGWERASVYEQDSSHSYNAYSLHTIPYSSHYPRQGLSTGDINNDGGIDIAIADYAVGLVLLKSNAQPVMTISDTLYYADTLNTATIFQPGYFEKGVVLAGNSSCMIKQTDLFQIKKYFQTDSIRTDTVYVRNGNLCSVLYADSISHIHFRTDSLYLHTDSVLVSSRVDTILTSSIFYSLVFPNPMDEKITLTISGPCLFYDQNMETQIEIFDSNGRLVYRNSYLVSEYPVEIDMRQLANGIYFLRCLSNENVYTNKIIKN